MSLMLKLLIATLLLITSSFAKESNLEKFIKNAIGANPNVKELSVKTKSSEPIRDAKGWRGVVVELKGRANTPKGEVPFSEQSIYFTNGKIMAPDLVDMRTGVSYKDIVRPKVSSTLYKKSNLLYGNADAKHKIIIFSDPLCPYCQRLIPGMIDYIKRYPKTFALYYYHFPLTSIHPAAVTLTEAMSVAQVNGKPEAIAKAYRSKVSAKESDKKKIIAEFNRTTGLKVTLKETQEDSIKKHVASDISAAIELMINGTPTIFFDGKKDSSRMMYKTVKTVD